MSHYRFKLKPEEIEKMIPEMGSCIASDKITIQGLPVGFMYREEPQDENDTGWRFIAGTESQEFIDDPLNSMVFEVNVIANYDPAIIPYIHLPVGSELERMEETDQFILLSTKK
jgi:hypothetical protein